MWLDPLSFYIQISLLSEYNREKAVWPSKTTADHISYNDYDSINSQGIPSLTTPLSSLSIFTSNYAVYNKCIYTPHEQQVIILLAWENLPV